MTATTATTTRRGKKPAPAKPAPPPLLTYEAYMAEGEVFKRYDILDGVRVFMANPNRVHQRDLGNLYDHFRAFERATKIGQVILAPCDVLITRRPFRTRQPDLLFISHEQLAKCPPATDPTPLEVAPELVVEILSPSETRRLREKKLADYGKIGVKECWVVSPQAETVEVLRLSAEGAETVAVYSNSQSVQSALFPDLTFPVADIFAE